MYMGSTQPNPNLLLGWMDVKPDQAEWNPPPYVLYHFSICMYVRDVYFKILGSKTD